MECFLRVPCGWWCGWQAIVRRQIQANGHGRATARRCRWWLLLALVVSRVAEMRAGIRGRQRGGDGPRARYRQTWGDPGQRRRLDPRKRRAREQHCPRRADPDSAAAHTVQCAGVDARLVRGWMQARNACPCRSASSSTWAAAWTSQAGVTAGLPTPARGRWRARSPRGRHRPGSRCRRPRASASPAPRSCRGRPRVPRASRRCCPGRAQARA